TINSALPTGGTNFQSFADAIAAMNCGIAGPVTFNVAPGTYNQQIIIPQILNTSSTNTVTFNGNGAVIQYNATGSADRTALILNGADHITIDSFVIDVSGGATYGWGIALTGGADSNR